MMKLLLTTLLLGILSACSHHAPSTSDRLQGRNWLLVSTKRTVTDAAGTVLSTQIILPDGCFVDNYFTLLPDHILSYNTGAVHCLPTEPQTQKGEWYLDTSQRTLLFTPDGDGFGLEGGTITELTDSSLRVLYTTSSDIPGDTNTYTLDKFYKAM